MKSDQQKTKDALIEELKELRDRFDHRCQAVLAGRDVARIGVAEGQEVPAVRVRDGWLIEAPALALRELSGTAC